MAFHEYLLAFFAVLVALVAAEFLLGWYDIYRHRRRLEMCWLLIAWSVLAFLLMLQSAWGLWLDREGISRNTGQYFFTLIANPIYFHVACMLFFPRFRDGVAVDLDAYFARNRDYIFLFAIGLLVVYVAEDWLVRGASLLDRQNVYRALGIGLFFVGLADCRRRLDWALWTLASLGIAVFVIDIRVDALSWVRLGP